MVKHFMHAGTGQKRPSGRRVAAKEVQCNAGRRTTAVSSSSSSSKLQPAFLGKGGRRGGSVLYLVSSVDRIVGRPFFFLAAASQWPANEGECRERIEDLRVLQEVRSTGRDNVIEIHVW